MLFCIRSGSRGGMSMPALTGEAPDQSGGGFGGVLQTIDSKPEEVNGTFIVTDEKQTEDGEGYTEAAAE